MHMSVNIPLEQRTLGVCCLFGIVGYVCWCFLATVGIAGWLPLVVQRWHTPMAPGLAGLGAVGLGLGGRIATAADGQRPAAGDQRIYGKTTATRRTTNQNMEKTYGKNNWSVVDWN